ncbi:MAG: hypothetical protein AAF614_13835 [Chloroflexota bacterium]
MDKHAVAHSLEWLEEKTKPLFVVVALVLYAIEVGRIATTMNVLENLDEFLIAALAGLSIPFSVILMQELLELVAYISDSNLLSARRQFEIVLLVIVRSFFKSFSKVNSYVDDGVLGGPVQEAIVKVLSIIALMFLIHFFRVMAESKHLSWYSKQGGETNLYKQGLVVILIIFVLIYQLVFVGTFETIDFIRLVFTGLIIIEGLFLIVSIWKGNFGQLVLESSLVIALIFARFPLFASNVLSYALSVLGVAFATTALYLFYRIAQWLAAHPEYVAPE